MSRWIRWFVFSAGLVLLLTGVSKVVSAFGHGRVLVAQEPILGLEFRHLLLSVGLLEVFIALVCFFREQFSLATVLIAWLGTEFLVYRIGLSWMGWTGPCPCLGNLTEAIHISPALADNGMKFVLAYLLIGSYGSLLHSWWYGKKSDHFGDGLVTTAD